MTVNVHYPPNANPRPLYSRHNASVFLAGTIDMGESVDWQGQIIASLQIAGVEDVDVFNPRRADWDSAWKQSIDDPQFKAQVEWELNHIEAADIVVFRFEPGSMSPISLMELGLICGLEDTAMRTIIVSCPPGYWRRGNVEIMAARYQLQMVDDLDDLCRVLQTEIEAFN